VAKAAEDAETGNAKLSRRSVLLASPGVAAKLKTERTQSGPLIIAVAGEEDEITEGLVTIRNAALLAAFDAMEPGPSEARITIIPAGLKNVIAVLEGSDPVLRSQYVIVSAHYDHVGTREGGGDTIYNGANDNASSVAAMIETASALARARPRPRRSIVFIAFFGEEKGLIGSRYYAAHPVYPLEKTIVQINLEQLGRTDDTEGPRVAAATLTGFDYSEVGQILQNAARPLGVKILEHPKYSDEFFERSDNEALARRGIPAHTLSVAYAFPDYHKVSDEWPKLDYRNMALVTRALTFGVLAIANRTAPPKWTTDNPSAEKYAHPATQP
jgi:Zn-dependent M28 family amino/carboxypeptidase